MYAKFKQFVYWKLVPIIKIWKLLSWKYYLKTNDSINLIVGAGYSRFKGWFSTDIATLDVTNENHFKKYFKIKKINKILAEHVLEHLTDEELELMVKHLYKYSADDINIRIAVPDGYHSDLEYLDLVKPGGRGEGAEDHKHLFNYTTLSLIFEKQGFVSYPKEYWDEKGEFHTTYSNDDRNKDKVLHYTSLIVDVKKK